MDFAEFRRFFLLLPSAEHVVEYWLSAGAGAAACCDYGGRVALQEPSRAARRGSPWGHLLAGAAAGAASRTATAPLETLRLLAMSGRLEPGVGLWGAAQTLYLREGWRAL